MDVRVFTASRPRARHTEPGRAFVAARDRRDTARLARACPSCAHLAPPSDPKTRTARGTRAPRSIPPIAVMHRSPHITAAADCVIYAHRAPRASARRLMSCRSRRFSWRRADRAGASVKLPGLYDSAPPMHYAWARLGGGARAARRSLCPSGGSSRARIDPVRGLIHDPRPASTLLACRPFVLAPETNNHGAYLRSARVYERRYNSS